MKKLLGYITLVLMIIMAESCKYDSAGENNAKRDKLDSIAASMDVKALAAMADSMARRGDDFGELMTRQKLGKKYRSESEFEEAIDQHSRALELASYIQDTVEIVRALNNLGTNFRRLGILDEAALFHYQALTMCDRYSDKKSSLARKNRVVSLNGIGNIYMTMENYDLADSVLRAALAGEKELGSDLGQAINWANLGAIMQEKGLPDSAWHYYQQSLALNSRAGSQLGQALCYIHMGELSETAGNLDKATEQYSHAYDILGKTGDTWHWLEACQALARINIAWGDMNQARRYIALSDSAAVEIHSLEHRAQTYNLKYQMATKLGQVNDAFDNYLKCDALLDSVASSKNISQILNTRINFERQRRQAELDYIMAGYRTERWLKNLFLIMIALVVILAGVVIYLQRVRNHNQLLANQLLAEQLLAHSAGAAEALPEGDRTFLERFTQAVKTGINNHQLDMEEIASRLCMTGGQLRRKVYSITGTTPLAYANNVRMAEASRLLVQHPEMTVGDIAERCGFDDMAYFSRLFKKTYKLTPTQFRHALSRIIVAG